jgi:thioredoxin 1
MASSKNVLDVNDLNFETEVLQSKVPVLVDFSAVWCQPCKALAPIVDQVADETVGTFKVTKIDIDESPATARRFGIRGVPTVIVFKDGQVASTHVGMTNKQKLVTMLQG